VKGVLNLSRSEKNYRLSRILPSEKLAYYVEQYWIVRWNLPDSKTHVQENIPHPCIHLVLEKNNSRIVGAVTGKYSYTLRGQGKIIGIKFRPGGFRPFINHPVSGFTDRTLSLVSVFGEPCGAFIQSVLMDNDESSMIKKIEDFLISYLPVRKDRNVEIINRIIDRISTDRRITRVEDLTALHDIHKRRLQRLFRTYVGVGPKWVIRKYRLHEVLEKMEAGEADWQQLILDVGYHDQAHFIKDFKAIIGTSPLMYMQGSRGQRT
jgi:AraC-like DNA-binding protein